VYYLQLNTVTFFHDLLWWISSSSNSVCLYVCRLVVCLVHVSVCGGISVEIVPVCLMKAADIVSSHIGHRIGGREGLSPPCFRQLPYSQCSCHSWLCVLQTPTFCMLPPPLIYPRTGLEDDVDYYTQSEWWLYNCAYLWLLWTLSPDLCQLMVANVTERKECCT